MSRNDNNSFFSFTNTTGLPTGIVSAAGIGVVKGGVHSSGALTKGFNRSSELLNNLEGNPRVLQSMLGFIEACNNFNEMPDIPGLGIMKSAVDADSLQSVGNTRDLIASVSHGSASVGATLVTHLTQSISDLGASASRVASFIKDSKTVQIQWQASTLGNDEKQAGENFFAHCQLLQRNISDHLKKLNQRDPQGQNGQSHQGGREELKEKSAAMLHDSLVGSSAQGVVLPSVSAVGTLSLGLDIIGSALREIQATARDSSQHSADEQEVYEQLSNCLRAFSGSDLGKSLNELNGLLDKLVNFWHASDAVSQRRAVGSRPCVSLSFLASTAFLLTLKSTVLSALTLVRANEALSADDSKLSVSVAQSSDQASQLRDAPLPDAAQVSRSHSHSLNVTELIEGFTQVGQALKLNDIQGVDDKSAIRSAAWGSHASTACLALLPSLVTGLLGAATRELAGGTKFLREVQGSRDQSGHVCKSDSDLTGDQLDQLLIAAFDICEGLEHAKRLGVSLPASLALSGAASSGSLVGVLNTGLGMLSAIKELRKVSETVRPDFDPEGEVKQRRIHKKEEIIKDSKNSNASVSQSVSSGMVFAEQEIKSNSTLDPVAASLERSQDVFDDRASDALGERKDLNMTGRSLVIVGRDLSRSIAINSSGFLTGALGAVAFVALESGISTEVLLRSLSRTLTATVNASGNIRSISGGPDQLEISGSHTNLSFLSNFIRFLADKTQVDSAEESKSFASSVLVTAGVAEAISSRSLIVALSQSGVLSAALKKLTEEVAAADQVIDPGSSALTLISADERVLSRLGEIIEGELNKLEQAKGQQEEQRGVGHLNQSMASQLQSISQSSIATALTTHSSIILPFITASRALERGSQESKESKHGDQHLSGSSISQEFSRGLNIIQGFTHACITGIQDEMKSERKGQGSLLESHESSEQGSLGTALFSANFSLLLEELLEMTLSRSLAIIDSAAIIEMSGRSLNIVRAEVSQNSALSSAQLQNDSRSGESHSILQSRSLSALRLILTRYGEALEQCAGQLAQEVAAMAEEKSLRDLPAAERDMEMHTIQRSLLQSMGSALTHCASAISQIVETTGGLSLLPILSRDKIDRFREFIHSSDRHLAFGEVKSSRNAPGKDDECKSISLPTSFVTDMAVSMVVNLVKTLFKASLSGSDVLLAVAKILEIVSLHEDPLEGSLLEVQGSVRPAVGSSAPSKTALQMISALLAIPSVSLAAASGMSRGESIVGSIVGSSAVSLQEQVDAIINSIEVFADKGEVDDEKVGAAAPPILLNIYFNRVLEHIFKMSDRDQRHKLIDRFHKGGIILSQYHRKYGGINPPDEKQGLSSRAPLIPDKKLVVPDELKPIENARALIQECINKIYSTCNSKTGESNALQAFTDALGDQTPSAKTRQVHQYILSKIASRLYLEHHSANATLFGRRRKVFDKQAFITRYSLGGELAPAASADQSPALILGPADDEKHSGPAAAQSGVMNGAPPSGAQERTKPRTQERARPPKSGSSLEMMSLLSNIRAQRAARKEAREKKQEEQLKSNPKPDLSSGSSHGSRVN